MSRTRSGRVIEVKGDGGKFIGLYLGIVAPPRQRVTKRYWNMCKEKIICFVIERSGLPLEIQMPCGQKLVFKSVEEITKLPIKDVPCPCGDPNHWLVKVAKRRLKIIYEGQKETNKTNTA